MPGLAEVVGVGVGVRVACPAMVPALAGADRVVNPTARQIVTRTAAMTVVRGTSLRDVEESPGMVGDRLVRLHARLVRLA